MFYAVNYCSWVTADIGKISVSGKCVKCNKMITVVVLVSEIAAYRRGEKIQNAMPRLSDSEREFLISGFCTECWDSLFPGTDVVEGEEKGE